MEGGSGRRPWGGWGVLLVLVLLVLPASGAASLHGAVREVGPEGVRLESGERLAWRSVGRVLVDGFPVPRQVVAPGDRVLSWQQGTLALRPRLVRGAFWDLRHGDLLLGEHNLVLPEGTEVRHNGRRVAASGLARGAAAVARLDPSTGRVGLLEVVDPGRATEVGDIWEVRAGLEPGEVAPGRALRAGETLHLELRAPAGGEASFDVAGVAWSLPAREVLPGLYRAGFAVPRALDVRDTFVLGHWRREGRQEGVRLGPRVSLAPTPPRLLDHGPRGPALADTPVFASYRSPGSWIEPSRVRLWVDGVERTGQARRTVDLVWWQPEESLWPGAHEVRVLVVDGAGNRVQHRWSFGVACR